MAVPLVLAVSTSPAKKLALLIETIALARLRLSTSVTVMPASTVTGVPPAAKVGVGLVTVTDGGSSGMVTVATAAPMLALTSVALKPIERVGFVPSLRASATLEL